MSDLISRSKLQLAIKRSPAIMDKGKHYVRLDAVLGKLLVAPAVDAVPVVHAENVTPTHYSDDFICGNCGFCCEITEIRHDDEDDFGLGGASVYEYECKFCPDCGAKMDGGAEGV